MKSGDSPVLFVYPPDELSDESVHAISEFLHEICRSFEQHYHRRINRYADTQEREARERIYTGNQCEIKDGDLPF
jgi:hypothetical protein